MISMKMFETCMIYWSTTERNFWNFFQNFWSTLFSRNEVFAGKMWFRHYWSYKPRDSGPPRARNSNFNNSIDISKWEEHLEFFQNFSSTPFSRNYFWSPKDAAWARENVTENATSGLLMHRLQHVMTRSISLSKKNTSNFFQNFSSISFSRNNFKVRKTRLSARKCHKKCNFRPY